MYKDRVHAARCLAKHLEVMEPAISLILAIPRGGVIVGQWVALDLGVSLDVVMAKKVSAPFNPEFAVAAVDGDGCVTLPPDGGTYAPGELIEKWSRIAKEGLDERLRFYRAGRKPERVSGKHVAILDDGLATGLTALAAIKFVRRFEPERLTLAVPVAPRDTLETLGGFVDEVVCPLTPYPFYAVGQWYESFDQVGDETVRKVLSDFEPF